MRIAVKANVRTAEGAKHSIKDALAVAFSGAVVLIAGDILCKFFLEK
jgi:K(+)-stimulated pyrophosphate-energized sodium pump